MSIELGGHSFTTEEVIAAIAAMDNPAPLVVERSIEEVNGVLQAVLHRLSALEDRLPFARAGFAVTTIPGSAETTHIVQCLDEQGRTVKITYEIPNS
tara:strand:- start:2054 stop:2344 length:291 start_codon:yes stop_codon:yes gene_type:complete